MSKSNNKSLKSLVLFIAVYFSSDVFAAALTQTRLDDFFRRSPSVAGSVSTAGSSSPTEFDSATESVSSATLAGTGSSSPVESVFSTAPAAAGMPVPASKKARTVFSTAPSAAGMPVHASKKARTVTKSIGIEGFDWFSSSSRGDVNSFLKDTKDQLKIAIVEEGSHLKASLCGTGIVRYFDDISAAQLWAVEKANACGILGSLRTRPYGDHPWLARHTRGYYSAR